MGRLDGKVAFITGAARGVGRAHAIRLASEGADIIALDLCAEIPGAPYRGATIEQLQETARMVEAAGGRVVAERADVRDAEQLRAVVDRGVAELGRLDIVAVNAGISTAPGPAELLAEELWSDMIDVTLTGAWRSCVATIPHLRAGGRGGSIVFTNSVAGLKGVAGIAHYSAAKHGVVGLMRSLALELAPAGIRVNSIHPAQVETDMIMNEATMRFLVPGAESPDPAAFAAVSQAMNVMPVPWAEPRDISAALLFLASEEARYITGVALPVDLGTLAR